MKEKKIILDSGPIITLALNNNLLWLLEKTKSLYNFHFYITEAVKKEIIDNPLATKKFKFEAIQVMRLLNKGIIEVAPDKPIKEQTEEFLNLANSSLSTQKRNLELVHYAEVSAVAAFFHLKADAMMIDERTTRYLLERPKKLQGIMSHKLHTKVNINNKPLSDLRRKTKGIRLIRSAEFVAVCFEKGLLDEFLPDIPNSRKTLLDAIIWGMKLNGCAISTRDLKTLIRETR